MAGYRRILLVGFNLVFGFSLYGSGSVKFKKISIEQGLPGVSVQSVAQDHNGLMWFGVEGSGLAMYDGRNFTLFSNDDNDSTSLSNNFINSIVIDNQNRVWLATLHGLNCFDRDKNHFRRFIHSPDVASSIGGNYLTSSMLYSDGTVWVGSENGVSIFCPQKNAFLNLRFSSSASNVDRYGVQSLYCDADSQVWVGTTRFGLLCLTKSVVLDL
ncbi:two component regulator with propeller domain [Breznakibacter xylanolyticus]|uniref:Two component regulator with propeller domain n=1 Tax=Breznakibacter xylanolyticus TaxID=990 RepID=A0A2W7NIH3_9BACT|nr:two-component regulator propeller domain-containing protein [Breznakibacter xylanolyticus]PZX12966.1 two component regulator with propeller domain [Breznakibacter xylanolyticus]